MVMIESGGMWWEGRGGGFDAGENAGVRGTVGCRYLR